MILGTHRKTSNWRSRTAAAVMIIGAATLSAPLIQADAHPETEVSEEELAGKYSQHQGKSVIKRKVRVDGKTKSEHFEINVNGDDVKAYKVGPFGKKTPIDVEDIEGVDVADILEEKIEGDDAGRFKKSQSFSFTISDGDGVKSMSRDDFKKWAETEYPEWKENDFASWVEGDFGAWVSKRHKGKLVLKNKDGSTRFEFNDFPKPPKAPFPPRFSKQAENEIIIRSDTFEGLEGLAGLSALESLKGLKGLEKLEGLKSLEKLKALKGLEGLEKLEALKDLEGLDGFETYSFIIDDDSDVKLKMRMTESKLAAARAMLENTEVDVDDSREMAKAKRELEKARKALKAAEQALQDAK